jgi:ferredoxin
LYGHLPEFFDLDDDDYAVVKVDPLPSQLDGLAEQSIAEWPRAALLRAD